MTSRFAAFLVDLFWTPNSFEESPTLFALNQAAHFLVAMVQVYFGVPIHIVLGLAVAWEAAQYLLADAVIHDTFEDLSFFVCGAFAALFWPAGVIALLVFFAGAARRA